MGKMMTSFDGDADLSRILEHNSRRASFIKLTMDKRSVFCRKNDIPVYENRHLDRIFDFSQKNGLPVACHCLSKWGFKRAMKYPVASIEHMVTDDFLTDAEITEMARRKIAIVPTLTGIHSYLAGEAYETLPAGYRGELVAREIAERREYFDDVPPDHCDPVLHRANMAMLAYYRELGFDRLWENKKFLPDPGYPFSFMKYGSDNLSRLKEAGVLIGCGIDAGTPFNYFGGLYREIEALARYGFSAAEALACATINNARILGMEDKIGSIEKGKRADLVVLEENPLQSPKAARRPLMVFKAGRLAHTRRLLVRRPMGIQVL
jgi:imidazolonepropionase-like amidohydrolase